ncbi:MAG: hypothetical protein QHJ73_18300 [Armatimonadota bacterium]|nr:hypothetical protein [Armatimonadota bacterium]
MTSGPPDWEECRQLWRLVAGIALVLVTALVWFWTFPRPEPGREVSVTVRAVTGKP